ncbi:hypothetical protein SLU01_20510 [Sporosarcina luteola]|uniref:50S ribosomal protein L29 n=1 Tax=Sporosarcina luteola TaxID=582850 RepID=A0A511Z8G0_9BACL|nr:50S ribosomal protein L29 [Sporosarcina luteola]GEN83739.1 hypothetical protein SLU01_20510 [Sporosarcina luteola]
MNNETVIGLSRSDKVIIIVFPPIIGALIGWFIPTIAGWLIKIPFIPLEKLFQWLASLDGFLVSIIGLAIGVIAGILFTMYAFAETLKVTVSDFNVKLLIKDRVEIFEKKDVATVFMRAKQLIILGLDGMELYRAECESKKEVVEEAFTHHGYSWSNKDPFENQYYRWVDDHPDFTAHINTLLSVRERALKKGESDEAEVLRRDLTHLGIVIHDKDERQYVRMVRGDDK